MLYDGLGSWNRDSPNHWEGEYDDYDRWRAVFDDRGKDAMAMLVLVPRAGGARGVRWALLRY